MKYDLIKKISCGLFLVFILAGCSLANNQWTHYPPEEYSIAFDIDEDLNGDLWVTTSSLGSISVFDPSTESWFFRHLPDPITSDYIRTLSVSQEGDVWVGTKEGMIRYQFHQDTGLFSIGETVLIKNDIRTILQDSRGTLWVGTAADGLFRSVDNGLTWQAISIDSQNELKIVFHIYEDNHNKVWISAGPGIYTNEGGGEEWVLFTHPNQPQLLERRVDTIFEDSRGNLWFGTTVGLVQHDPDRDQWQTFTTDDVLPDGYVHAIAEDKTGDLWFGTSDGVTRFSPANGEWRTFNEEDGFIDGQVMDILIDRGGNLWFVTFWDGIFKYYLN
jgi:ligand-binding sensor domain-containing protein